MDDELFSAKNTSFWGALAAAAVAAREYFKFKGRKLTTEAENNLAQTMEKKAMEAKKGIKETKEALEALEFLSLFIISKVKDGVQVQDGVDLVSSILLDADMKGKISAAVDKIHEVPQELGDLELGEILELSKFAIDSVPKYVEALKKV